MTALFRTRDVEVHFKGDSYPVAIHPDLLASGWAGGQGVMWCDSPLYEFRVQASDGIYGGFLLWGSDEISDRLLGQSTSQLAYGYGIFCAGGWLASFATYEKYTWNSRHGIGPPNVLINYTVGERVRFSNRGWWTNEDEFTKVGDPRAPNNYFVGYVVQKPRADNDYRLVLQTSI